MAGPRPGEDISAYRERRRQEMAHERGEGPAPAGTSFEQKKAQVAAKEAARKSAPSGGGKPINLDRAAEDEDEVRSAHKRVAGGVKALDPEAIKAADKELSAREKAVGVKAAHTEREEGARVAGRSRFDLDAPAPAPASAAQKAPGKAPKRSPAPLGQPKAAPVQVRQMGSPPGGSGPSGEAPKAKAPSAPVAKPVATASPVSNPSTMAPTPSSRPADAEPARPSGTPAMPSVPAGQQESGGPAKMHVIGSKPAPGVTPAHMVSSGQGRLWATPQMANKAKKAAGQVSGNVQPLPGGPGVTGHANAETEKAAESMPGNPVKVKQSRSAPSRPANAVAEEPELRRPQSLSRDRGVWGWPGVQAGSTGLNAAQSAHADISDGESNAGNAAARATPSVTGPRPTGMGRPGVKTPRETSPRGGVHIEGSGNVVGSTVTSNTYNYHVGGDVYGNVGGGGGAATSRPGRAPGGSPRGGSRIAPGHHPEKSDIWVNLPSTGHHSLREGIEHVTGQADSSGHPTARAAAHERQQRQGAPGASAGGSQRPIGGSQRASGGSSGTGTNFNWTGPSPAPQPMPQASTGGSTGTGYGRQNNPVTP